MKVKTVIAIGLTALLVGCGQEYEYETLESDLQEFKEFADNRAEVASGGTAEAIIYDGDCTHLFAYIEKYTGEHMNIRSTSEEVQMAFDKAKTIEKNKAE